MILKGSQRSGGNALAVHLMNELDNDHVTIFELRGFVSTDLKGAFQEVYAISKGTQCRQYLFSLSLNPPQKATATEQDFINAIERAEETLGLKGQPRATVLHEKNGRRHAHVVWSRIDVQSMTAIRLSHFKRKLNRLARDLYLEHGWNLPDGLKVGGGKSPLNFTLEEWQQAKRLGMDPREIKQAFQEAWQQSDNLRAFTHAMEERGYFIARGDRRGFVAIDTRGEIFSVSRYVGVKTKDVRAKLGDPAELPPLIRVRNRLRDKLTVQFRQFSEQVDGKHHKEMQPLEKAKLSMRKAQRDERFALHVGQKKRWENETRLRSARLNSGLKGLWQFLSGAAARIKSENIAEAIAGLKRDQEQRDALVHAQLRERQELQKQIDRQRRKHALDQRLLSRETSLALRFEKEPRRPEPSTRDLKRIYRGPSR